MIYRRDNNERNGQGRFVVPVFVVFLLISFFLLVPSSAFLVGDILGKISSYILGSENKIGKNLENYKVAFSSKKSLLEENESLKMKIVEDSSLKEKFDYIEKENTRLKELLNRNDGRKIVLGEILVRPNHSPYDTFIVDIGKAFGVEEGAEVYDQSGILIGKVEEVYGETSRVGLFSNPDNKIQVFIGEGNPAIEVTGRGGGNFDAVIPNSLNVKEGDVVVAPSLSHTVIGYVGKIITDPRNPFVEVLIQSRVNLSTIREVGISIK